MSIRDIYASDDIFNINLSTDDWEILSENSKEEIVLEIAKSIIEDPTRIKEELEAFEQSYKAGHEIIERVKTKIWQLQFEGDRSYYEPLTSEQEESSEGNLNYSES